MHSKTNHHTLPVTVGIIMLGFGINQLLNSKKWTEYVPPVVSKIAPVKDSTVIKLHGSGNLSLGLLFLILHKNKLVQWVTALWWVNVMVLCGRHSWREGLRDLPIVISLLKYASRVR
jgi:hypothetical protein